MLSSTELAGVTATVGSCSDSAVLDATSGRKSVARSLKRSVTAVVASSGAAAPAGDAVLTARPVTTDSETMDANADFRAVDTWFPGATETGAGSATGPVVLSEPQHTDREQGNASGRP